MASLTAQILDEYPPEAVLAAAVRIEEGPLRRPNAARRAPAPAAGRRRPPPPVFEGETSYEPAVADLMERYGPEAILSAAARIAKPRLHEESLQGADQVHRFAVQMWPELIRGDHEFMPVIGFDSGLRPVAAWLAASGGLASAPVDPRMVFATALKKDAGAVIALHGHPSGDPEPSVDDQRLTLRLTMAGNVIGVSLLDHIVVGDGSYFSFSEAGRMT